MFVRISRPLGTVFMTTQTVFIMQSLLQDHSLMHVFSLSVPIIPPIILPMILFLFWEVKAHFKHLVFPLVSVNPRISSISIPALEATVEFDFHRRVYSQELPSTYALLTVIKSEKLAGNQFLLLGVESSRLQPSWNLLEYDSDNVRITDVTSLFPPTKSILSGFSLHVLQNRVVLIGGGGVFYWMHHFNNSCMCDLPPSLNFSPSHCVLQNGISNSRRETHSHQLTFPKRDIPQKQLVLVVNNPKLVRL